MGPVSAKQTTLQLCLAGDVMTGRGIDHALPQPGAPELREAYAASAGAYLELARHANGAFATPIPPAKMWGAAAQAWRALGPDLRLFNLETAITASDAFADKAINYRMSPANIAVLTAARPGAVCLANNHVLDFGREGLADTLAALRGAGIAAAGVGADLAQACRPAILEFPAGRVLFYAAACIDSGVPPNWAARSGRSGVHLIEPSPASATALAERISVDRCDGDTVVVSIHWGSNWGHQVPEAHRRFAHALVDTDLVSVIHGHSSHHPRPLEVRRDRLILYGCGDLLNDYEGILGYEAFRPEVVAMYFADLDAGSGALQRLRIAPFRIRRFRLERASHGDAAWLASTLSRVSRDFGVEIDAPPEGLLEARWTPG